jgi:hypothetical protein
MKTIDWALERLSENSTWRGLILATGLSVIGLINIIRKGPAK